MAITDSRICPMAQLRVMRAGQGDPTVSSPWWGWYDVLRETRSTGTINRTADNNYTLEWVEEIGLTCRPFLVLQDTRLTQYTVSGGAWEEQRPSVGNPRKYRLVQYNSTANQQWSATSKFFLPTDPHLALGYIFADTPPDHNGATQPPYLRLEFGNSTWAVQISKIFGAQLLQRVSGVWSHVADLPQPSGIGADLDERFIWLRVLRGQLCISLDYGKTYTRYGSGVSVTSSPFVVRGQGGVASFGLHQLFYAAGTYQSRAVDTADTRTVPTTTLTARKLEPTGTSVVFTDLGTARNAQYRATLTPVSVTVSAGPFLFYRTPELYAVRYEIEAETTLGSGGGAFTLPFDDDTLEVDLDHPFELDGAVCTVRAWRDHDTPWEHAYRWPKCLLVTGELGTDGVTVTWHDAFLGYLRNPEVVQDGYRDSSVCLTIDNVTARLKAKPWGCHTVPYGGMTLNAALDAVLATEGLPLNTAWDPVGDSIILPPGSPEEPGCWPQQDERKWETMAGWCRDANLELGVRNNGTWFTVPRNYVAPVIAHVWDAELANGELKDAIVRVSATTDASEAATATFVYGKEESGSQVSSYGVDSQAETNPASPRFCEIGRILTQRTLSGTTTLGQCNIAAQGDFAELTALKEHLELEAAWRLQLARRDLAQVLNTNVGAVAGKLYVVLSFRTQLRPNSARSRTVVGLRRVL